MPTNDHAYLVNLFSSFFSLALCISGLFVVRRAWDAGWAEPGIRALWTWFLVHFTWFLAWLAVNDKLPWIELSEMRTISSLSSLNSAFMLATAFCLREMHWRREPPRLRLRFTVPLLLAAAIAIHWFIPAQYQRYVSECLATIALVYLAVQVVYTHEVPMLVADAFPLIIGLYLWLQFPAHTSVASGQISSLQQLALLLLALLRPFFGVMILFCLGFLPKSDDPRRNRYVNGWREFCFLGATIHATWTLAVIFAGPWRFFKNPGDRITALWAVGLISLVVTLWCLREIRGAMRPVRM